MALYIILAVVTTLCCISIIGFIVVYNLYKKVNIIVTNLFAVNDRLNKNIQNTNQIIQTIQYNPIPEPNIILDTNDKELLVKELNTILDFAVNNELYEQADSINRILNVLK